MKTLESKIPWLFIPVLLITAIINPDLELESIPQDITAAVLDKYADTVVTEVMNNDYSVGYLFTSDVSGKVTKLGIKLPEPGIYKVSIWDVESRSIILQTTIHQAYGKWSMKEIPPIYLVSDRTYAVCSLLPIGAKYFSAQNLNLPKDVNGVRILRSVAAFGDNYPVDQEIPDAIFGFVDFTFEASQR